MPLLFKLPSWFSKNQPVAVRRAKPGLGALTPTIVSPSLTVALMPLQLRLARADPSQAITTDVVPRTDHTRSDYSSAGKLVTMRYHR